MLCPFCDTYADGDQVVCPSCGKLLPRGENRDQGVMAIRQGKRAREEAASGKPPIWMERQGTNRVFVDPNTRPQSGGEIPLFADPEIYSATGEPDRQSIDRPRHLVYGEADEEPPELPLKRNLRSAHTYSVGQRGVNWARIALIALILLVMAVAGGFVWLRGTPEGQRFSARHGWQADASALWVVGQERMDTGDLDGAIADYEQAAMLDGDENVAPANLIRLAEAYEAANRIADAEAIYVHIYTDLVPSASEAYTSEIRIMLAQGRDAEAAELLVTAYSKTGNAIFNRQRKSLLPSQPVTNLTAGLHTDEKDLILTSPENYAIYYTFDEKAELPAGGILYEKAIHLDEGSWPLRAVCVNGELVSEELAAIYRVSKPSPSTPKANVAPNTYKTKRYVSLRKGEGNEKDKDITIYYTIDGSMPDGDSPVFEEGKPIVIGGGYTTLRAVAVNGYGKASNTLEILYKVEARPWPKEAYTTQDTTSVRLNYTTYEAFSTNYGEGDRFEAVEINGYNSGTCRRYYYSWGYATFQRVSGTFYLIETYCTNETLKGPRKTAVGNTADYVVSCFRDMGQVESPSGNRGLYSNSDGVGKIYHREDGTRVIYYLAYTADSHAWQLEYTVNSSGVVTSIYTLLIL